MADHVVHFYSEKRRHSSIDYLSPNEFEDEHQLQTQTMPLQPVAGNRGSSQFVGPVGIEAMIEGYEALAKSPVSSCPSNDYFGVSTRFHPCT